MRFRVCDAFCGIGGYSAGAVSLGCVVELGVEMDDRIARPFAKNTRGRAVCAVIGKDEVPWPTQSPDLLVHLSPPCTALSKARAGSASDSDVEGGLELLRFSLDLVIEKGYSNWSLENVSTATTRGVLDRFVARHPDKIQYATFDAADYGTPQTRVRLIASTPATIKLMQQEPVRRVTVADAFAAAGLPLPADHLKSSTSNRNGTPCVRSVHGQAFTVIASHPLTWCHKDGSTVRCLTPIECALLQGFPMDWTLPTGSRLGVRAAGNAIPPPMAASIVRCLLRAAGLSAPSPPPIPKSPSAQPPAPRSAPPPLTARDGAKERRSYVTHAKHRALKRRVKALESTVCSLGRMMESAAADARRADVESKKRALAEDGAAIAAQPRLGATNSVPPTKQAKSGAMRQPSIASFCRRP